MSGNRTRFRVAQIAIIILFLALIRNIGEYFRLKYIHGAELQPYMFEPFLKGAAFTAACTLLAVIFYFLNRLTLVIVVAALTVICLFIYKLVLMNAGFQFQ
jgi:hypothetical protein